MRLQRFDLDRFGHFENKTLDLSSDAIHVIHGANASGKSTIRTAIAELLFGIEERTSYNFRFENNQLRLGGKLVTRDGHGDISIRRYKRRTKSLASDGDVDLEEAILFPFLGGLDKATFLDLYVMDQDALRKGGEHMLSAEGDVGRSLFAASSGFADIASLRVALKDELEEIASVGQRRKTHKLWSRVEDYNQALQNQRASQLRKAEWDAAQKALTQANEQNEKLATERQELETSRSLLERVKAVSLILPRMDRSKGVLEEFAQVPELPRGFAENWRKSESEFQSAKDAETAAEIEKNRVDGERALLPKEVDTLLTFEEEIDSLHQAIGNITDLRQAKIKLERDVQHDTDRLNDSFGELGSNDPESNKRLIASIPAKAVCFKIEELIAEKGRIDTALKASEARKTRAQQGLDDAKQVVVNLTGAVDPSDAEAKWKASLTQGNVQRGVSQAKRKAEEARTTELAAIAKLAPWTGSPGELLKLVLPSDDLVASYAEKLRQNDNELKSAQDAEGKARASLKEVDEVIAPLKLAGEVPTESNVKTARSERDERWGEISGPAEAGQRISPQTLANYAGLVHRADDLIDLYVASKELPALLRNRAAKVGELEESEGRIKRAKDQQSQESDNWQTLWDGLKWPAEQVPAPQKMQIWLAQTKICIIAIDARVRAEAAQTEAESEEQEAREAATRIAVLLGLTPSADQFVDQIRDQISGALTQSRKKWDDLLRAQAAVQQHEKENAAAVKEGETLQTSLVTWERKWGEAMPLIHQKVDLEPSDCRRVLGLWTTIREQHTARSSNQSRRDGVINDLQTHEQSVRAFVEKIGPEQVQSLNFPEDWALWPAKLHRGMQDAKAIAQQIEAAEKACANAARAHERSVTALNGAKKRSDDLRGSASLSSDANVEETIEHAAKKREASEQYFQAEKDLEAAGEGLSEEKLREEVAGIEPDQVKGQLATLGDRAIALDESVKQASQEHLLATQAIAKLQERSGGATAGLEAAAAAQDVKQLTQRWMRLRAAQILLDRAVERYRKSNEAPLIKRASEVFSAIVRGRMPDDFTELDVDYDNPEKPLIVARRRVGTSCSVPKMSTGTRDQLWLSLRIAALERRAEHIEPMPFLADDLFDSSDEARSIAMLLAIAELARHTQVIVFTHHAHVANMAAETLGARAQLHRL